MKPIRIQRKRTKGWRMPVNTIYVGRPTFWGNPWRVGVVPCGCRSVGECIHGMFVCETAREAVDIFRQWIESGRIRIKRVSELRGKNLACWCPLDQPCHADVLLELANKEEVAA